MEYAWQVAERFPCGVFFVSAESPVRLRASLAALAAADLLALPERRSADEGEVLAAVLRRLRDEGGRLMILDNADTAEAAAAVEELLGCGTAAYPARPRPGFRPPGRAIDCPASGGNAEPSGCL